MWAYNDYKKWEEEGGTIEKAVKAKTLSLQNKKLIQLNKHISAFKNLNILYLNNNRLTSLPDSICELIHLKHLDVQNNQLSALPVRIGNLTNLKWLRLSHNRLTRLPKSMSELRLLKGLELKENQLTTLDEDLFDYTYDYLETLDLEKNQLTTLPKSIGNLFYLESLYLDENQLTTLPKTIGDLLKLQTLSLNNNKLVELPERITELKKLENLHLDNNDLTEIDAKLLKIKNITYENNPYNNMVEWEYKDYKRWEEGGTRSKDALTVNSLNLFNVLPTPSLSPRIGKLKNLTTLDVRFNKLTHVPDSICSLTKLKVLYLNNNDLTAIPEDIGELSNLKILFVGYNHLTELPDSIGDLSKLETLYLQNNELTTIPDSIGVLNNLVDLRLDNNKLTSLPEGLIRLYNLNSLFLDNNELTEIPEELLTIPNITYENNRIRIKGAEMSAWTGDNAITTNRDPYYIYQWPIDIIMLWIKAGGGVKVTGSHMGCGLNVLACLGFIDRSELPRLIIEQEAGDLDRVKTGLSMTRIIELSVPEPATSYRFFIPFGKDKDATIRSALNDIEKSVKLPSPERYRYLIVKLIISKEKGLGHTILVAYDGSTDKLVTFDPQNCTPNKTMERDFVIFANYLSKSMHYEGISVIKYKTEREGGMRRKRKTLKKKGKKSLRRGGLVHTPFPFGLSKSKSHKIMEKSHMSKPKKIAPKTKELFNQLVDFVTDGEKKDKKLYAALKDWAEFHT